MALVSTYGCTSRARSSHWGKKGVVQGGDLPVYALLSGLLWCGARSDGRQPWTAWTASCSRR